MADTDPIAYEALKKGTPVVTATGTEIGTTEHVMADASLDVFDGIVVKTAEGLRFISADQVGLITVGKVNTKVADADVANLQKPHTANDVLHDDPDEMDGPGLSQFFRRLFFSEHWSHDKED
jgi:hypothetical protein